MAEARDRALTHIINCNILLTHYIVEMAEARDRALTLDFVCVVHLT